MGSVRFNCVGNNCLKYKLDFMLYHLIATFCARLVPIFAELFANQEITKYVLWLLQNEKFWNLVIQLGLVSILIVPACP